MARHTSDSDESSAIEGRDLRSAIKRLSRGPMKFAIGYKDRRTPVLLMHRTKSPRVLGNELKQELGARSVTHGTASADGKVLVLDVEGPRLSGMGKMVKTVLRQERISTYTQTRIQTDGVEEEEDEEAELDEPQGDCPAATESPEDTFTDETRELEQELLAMEQDVEAILRRLDQRLAEDEGALVGYCMLCVQFDQLARDCDDARMADLAQRSVARARKLASLLQRLAGSWGQRQAAPAGQPVAVPSSGPSAALSGSVGAGGGNHPTDVALVQVLLNRQGYALEVDGQCGSMTVGAIVDFQRKRLGFADGLVEPGRNTWRALTGQPLVQAPAARGVHPSLPRIEHRVSTGLEELEPIPSCGGYGTDSVENEQRIAGAAYSYKNGDEEAEILAGEVEVGPTGIKAKGAVLNVKTAEGELQVLEGQVELGPTGVAASGVVARSKVDGETGTLGQVEARKGVFTDGDRWWAGQKESLTVAKREIDAQEKYGLPDVVVAKGDLAVGTANCEASISDQGLSIGAQANLVEGSVTIGTTGAGDQDQTLRVGLSAGHGAAARVH